MAAASPVHGSAPLWLVCTVCFLAAVCRTQASTLANDIADLADDRAVGKERWIARLPGGLGVLVVAGLVGLGVVAMAAASAPVEALAAYLAATTLGLLYSIRPVRLKGRGLLGPIAFAASCVLVYVVVPWAWLRADGRLLAVLSPAVLLDKWVNLHFHQVVDYQADRLRGTRTYVARVGPERAHWTLWWTAWLASVSMLAVLALLALGGFRCGRVAAVAGMCVAALAVVYLRLARRRGAKGSSLVRELPWPYLGLTYGTFRLVPVVLLVALAFQERTMLIPAALAGLCALIDTWNTARYRYE